MKNLTKIVAAVGLMTAGFAQASVPADFEAMPGVLFVKWHATATIDGNAHPMLEVRDETGALITTAHADLTGTQQVRMPQRTQGTVMISMAGESSKYRIPFGIGDGKDR